jgi:hypothetical protein
MLKVEHGQVIGHDYVGSRCLGYVKTAMRPNVALDP